MVARTMTFVCTTLLCIRVCAEPLLEDFFGSRALKRLVLKGQEGGRRGAEARKMAAKLWHGAMEAKGTQLAGSHAAKACTPWHALCCTHGHTGGALGD